LLDGCSSSPARLVAQLSEVAESQKLDEEFFPASLRKLEKVACLCLSGKDAGEKQITQDKHHFTSYEKGGARRLALRVRFTDEYHTFRRFAVSVQEDSNKRIVK